MNKITGIVKDKNKNVICDASVFLMNECFEQVHQTLTDKNGKYTLELKDDYYPFLVIVKSYGEEFLEYWCQNINLNKNLVINCSIDVLEIYGLHCFVIKGAAPALTVYFRPMSLDKVKKNESDIAPKLTSESITVHINGEHSDVLLLNEIKEYGSEINMTAYLMQVTLPEKYYNHNENFLDIYINDEFGNYGQASIFF